jgi:hypothetical protein
MVVPVLAVACSGGEAPQRVVLERTGWGNGKTDLFEVQRAPWNVAWHFEPSGPGARLRVDAFVPGNPQAAWRIADTTRQGQGDVRMPMAGLYYLGVESANGEWRLEVLGKN